MTLRAEHYQFEGLDVACWRGGTGFPLLLIHGSGPGASTMGNWRLVLDRLAERYSVLAIDLIGFGQSARKPTPPYFDFDLWRRQALHALGLLDGQAVGVLGHSISGAIALKLAAASDRVIKVMTTGSMGTDMPVNDALGYVWRCPATREEMRRAGHALVYDKALIDDIYLDGRMAVIGAPDYRHYFDTMFAGDLAQYVKAALVTSDELSGIAADVLMLHGRDDEPYPLEQSTAVLAAQITTADMLALARCGHSVALEHPDKLLAAARMLFG